jgi:hypothetical protein
VGGVTHAVPEDGVVIVAPAAVEVTLAAEDEDDKLGDEQDRAGTAEPEPGTPPVLAPVLP